MVYYQLQTTKKKSRKIMMEKGKKGSRRRKKRRNTREKFHAAAYYYAFKPFCSYYEAGCCLMPVPCPFYLLLKNSDIYSQSKDDE